MAELKTAAQEVLKVPFLQVISVKGQLLNAAETLEEAGIHQGDVLTAIVQEPRLAATRGAFAFWCCGSGVVTWGNPEIGGDSSGVQDQLKDVQSIEASATTFAALRSDGSVVSWGHPAAGGDSSQVQDQLKDVQQTSLDC